MMLDILVQSAKIHLPSQILMLTPTKSKHHFIGIVFPGVSLMSTISHYYFRFKLYFEYLATRMKEFLVPFSMLEF